MFVSCQAGSGFAAGPLCVGDCAWTAAHGDGDQREDAHESALHLFPELLAPRAGETICKTTSAAFRDLAAADSKPGS